MPVKVTLDFPAAFEHDRPIPIELGRLLLGGYVARIFFYPDGKIHIHCVKDAAEFIHYSEEYPLG